MPLDAILINNWPSMMRRKTAAAYLDLSIAAFEREVIVGIIPQPVMLGGRESWSRKQIGDAMSRLTGEGEYDWRKDAPLYNREK